eukprot:4922074-Prymnesium_polylepis.1
MLLIGGQTSKWNFLIFRSSRNGAQLCASTLRLQTLTLELVSIRRVLNGAQLMCALNLHLQTPALGFD